jgi:hypothetical protein
MSADQRIHEVVISLEQQLCRGLGAAPLAQAIRNIKLKALKDGLGNKLPDVCSVARGPYQSNSQVTSVKKYLLRFLQAEFNQAVSFLEGKAADKKDFHNKLGRAQARK